MPKLYSIYQKVRHADGTTEWIGIHRLPISTAIKMYQEFRNRGYRAVLRLDGELGPSFKD